MTSRSYEWLGAQQRWLLIASCALPSACTEHRAPAVTQTFQDVCIDGDSDGFGYQCASGGDCDDTDPSLHEGCSGCQKPRDGCACEAGAKPVDCSVPLSVDQKGALICRTGTRYCRDGAWSACEGVASFSAASPARTLSSQSLVQGAARFDALVDPNAPVEACDDCHPGCFRVEDPLVTPPGYMFPGGVQVAPNGGITLAGEFPPGYQPPYSGFPDEAPCAADDLPDCDGIPSALDADPSRASADTAHRTLFMDLPPGSESTRPVEGRVFLSSADIYFYLDSTSTMRDELLRLVADFRSGNFLPDEGAGFDCVDANFDGVADNEKKTQGVTGNIACLVRDARFGAGWFREIPFYGPFQATDQAVAPWDTEMFEHRHDISGDTASVATALGAFGTRANINVPEGGMQGLWAIATGAELYAGWDRPGIPARTGCPAGTFGYPCFRNDALPIVLHFTDAPMQEGPTTRARAVPETDPATPANCLSSAERDDDSQIFCEPLHYDANVLSGFRAGSEGRYRALSSTAEDPARAERVGAIDLGLVTYTGSTENMSADSTYASLGGFVCPRRNAWSPVDERGPDAAFRFRVNTQATYLLSGRGTRFDATLMLFELNAAGTATRAVACSDTEISLGQPGELNNTPEIEMELAPAEYLLVLKGYRSSARGMFQVSFGQRNLQAVGSFAPKRWLGPLDDGVGGVREALRSRELRVITIQSGDDPFAREQATALAAATAASSGGRPLLGAIQNDGRLLGQEVVRVVRELALATQMDVSLALLEAPDDPAPNFGLRVQALATLGSGCNGVIDSDGDGTADTHRGCMALAAPQFSVTFSNGQGASAVPSNPRDQHGGYHMWLRVLGDGRYLLDQIPVYLIPENAVADPIPPLFSATGSYDQEVVANGCGPGEGPIWLSLLWEVGLPDGTEVAFDMCGADNSPSDNCSFTQVANVRPGARCIDPADCGTGGYCDASGWCHQVTSVACESHEQCGLYGSCTDLGQGSLCSYARNAVDLRQSTAQMRGRPLVRVRARLSASSDHTQAPTLLRWSLDYACTPLE